MKSIYNVLQDLEKLIYKILMWVILIPKTIVKITLNPAWAHGYITAELNPEHKDQESSPFDEYMSPVILLLVVALLPALIFNFLPTYSATVSSTAAEKPTTDRFLVFESLTDFRSASTEMDYFHVWIVEKRQADGKLTEIFRERHLPKDAKNLIELVDNNTVKDQFLYTLPDLESGEYYINVYAGKYDKQRTDAPVIELYNASLKVIVPVKLDEQVVVSSDSTKSVVAAGDKIGLDNIVDQIQKENTIFLALALMIPPLLFALATKLFIGDPIGENTLKENFYVQCYYFSPLSLAIWATYYAYYFFTPDAYFYVGRNVALPILLLPPILTAIWFFRTEIKTIAIEREISGAKPFFIVTVCIAVFGLAVYIFFSFANFQDRIRLLSIQAYPLLSAALLLAFSIAWYGRRRAENKPLTIRNLSWVFVSFVALAVVMRFISFKAVNIPDAPSVVAETQVAELPPVEQTQIAELPAVEQTQIAELPANTATLVVYVPIFADTPTPTVEATQIPVLETLVAEQPTVVQQPSAVVIDDIATLAYQPFYTEEFNGDIASWTPFLTSGDPRMVQQKVELGKLSIDLLQLEDKLPWYYLINNNYNYSDVKVEAVVTNRGVNANGISIICRYSDIGWYEFFLQYSGLFSIYAIDNAGIVNQGYNELANGGSALINSGLSTNVFTAECKGSELSLYVNQTLVHSFTDTQFNFPQGKIGIAVSSPDKLPVGVDFETLTISEP